MRIQEEAVNKLGSQSTRALKGRISVPGDKSISHRALMIGASAIGQTNITGLLEAEDVLHTADALRAAGVRIDQSEDRWTVNGVGVGGFSTPENVVDIGN